MTFWDIARLPHPAHFLGSRLHRRLAVRRPRPTPPRLEVLESRALLSGLFGGGSSAAPAVPSPARVHPALSAAASPLRILLSPPTVAKARARAQANDVWNFVTDPKLHPMRVSVQVLQPGTAPGLNFVSPYALSQSPGALVGQTGALIMDNQGNPVYFRKLSSTNRKQITDFRVQTLRGQPVLTWWQGTIAGTVKSKLPDGSALPGARFFIFDNHYRRMKTIHARHGFTADVHEFLLTPQGTALFIGIKRRFMDLRPFGGVKHGSFMNAAVQEVDLKTGRLVFEWDMFRHVPLSESIVPAPTSRGQVWDPYHLNSIDEGPDGRLLLSARNLWAVFEISRPTRQVRWQIGGKQNQFSFPPEAAFFWQHDARYRPDGISMFDDGCCQSPFPAPLQQGHGLILNLNFANHTASVRDAYPHDPKLFPNSQGNVQALPNGDEFIGWGSEPYYSEYTANGTVLYDVLMPGVNISYRAFRNTWVGIPDTRPKAAVRRSDSGQVVYASWDGSTETAAWMLLAGPNRHALSPVSQSVRTGFETAMATTAAGPFYRVKALDAAGHVLRTSKIVRLPK